MYKFPVLLLFIAVVSAQDLDAILLDIYGPDISTNMISTDSGEIYANRASAEYKDPITVKYERTKRKASATGEPCKVEDVQGICKPYYLCSETFEERLVNDDLRYDACELSIEICCLRND